MARHTINGEDFELPEMSISSDGRIYVDGFHVGWVKRDAGLVELLALSNALACRLPSLDRMLVVEERKV